MRAGKRAVGAGRVARGVMGWRERSGGMESVGREGGGGESGGRERSGGEGEEWRQGNVDGVECGKGV